MNVSNTRIYRLSSLLSALNLNVRRNGFNYAMIKAIDAGMTLVEEYFDKMLSEVFFDSAKNYGIKMMCDLLDLDEINYENVQKGLSQGFVKYKYDEFKEECLKTFDKNMTFNVSNFVFSAGGSKESFLSQILKNISYFENIFVPVLLCRRMRVFMISMRLMRLIIMQTIGIKLQKYHLIL